jgi:hypothetical protein
MFIVDLIDLFKNRSKINIKKYTGFIMWTIVLDFFIVIMETMGINISNEFNQGTKISSSLILFLLVGLSIGTFIPGVVQLIRKNDYKEIKNTAILLGIFYFMFLSFKLMGIF